jgi:hypothetical protein
MVFGVSPRKVARSLGLGLLALGGLSALVFFTMHVEAGGAGGVVLVGALALGGVPTGLLATWYGSSGTGAA